MAHQTGSPLSRHIKCEADKLRRQDPTLRQHQALDKAAATHGYVNWRHFQNSPDAILASHTVSIRKYWHDQQRGLWEESITLNTSQPLSELISAAEFRSEFDQHAELDIQAGIIKLSTTYLFITEHSVVRQRITRNEVATIARKIMFLNATGLKPSRAWARPMAGLIKRSERGSKPPCFDHTHVWKDAAGRYLVTTEPYVSHYKRDFDKLSAISSDAGYSVDRTQWPGMHNPDRNDTSHGTVLLLISPSKSGIPVSEIKQKLDQLPPSHQPDTWTGITRQC